MLAIDPKNMVDPQTEFGTPRTESTVYNDSTVDRQRFHEELNTAYNHHIIIEAIKSGRARDLSDEVKAPIFPEKMPAIIIGSGPSLDDSIEYLKEWKGGIFCSTSHALTLMHYGIEPTHIVGLDTFSLWDEIKGVDWSKTKTKLVTHPGVNSSLIEKWPNDMILFIENDARPDSFYMGTQKRMYSWREGDWLNPVFHYYIKTQIPIFSCSPPVQMIAAHLLGYGNMFLCGLDFSSPGNKDRMTSWTVDEDGAWVKHEFPLETAEHGDSYAAKKAISGNKLPTYNIQLYYKRNFISSWYLVETTLYTTDHGAIVEMPYTDIKKVIKTQGYGYKKQSHSYVLDHAGGYLASVGTFAIETDKGQAFVESANPEVDLPKFMQGVKRRFMCDKCSVTVLAQDDIDHREEKCPRCGEGKMIYEVGIDIDANMQRIHHLLDTAEKVRKMNAFSIEE
jgi:phage FluMu protein Com